MKRAGYPVEWQRVEDETGFCRELPGADIVICDCRTSLGASDILSAMPPDIAPSPDRRGGRDRRDLRADCARCFGLCCVAPAFAASADFAIDKPAGQACPHQQASFRCAIHSRLRQLGFPGCTVYDCFGAGQHVSQVTFGGQDWRRAPHTAQRMFDVFAIMRPLHELLWYLREALALAAVRPLHAALGDACDATERLTRLSPDELLGLDVAAHRRDTGDLHEPPGSPERVACDRPRRSLSETRG